MIARMQEQRWVLRDWQRRTTERAQLAVVWRLPRWLVYWCAIRLGSHATTGRYGATDPTSLPFMEALKRWDDEPSPTGKGAR